ncbi:Replication factor C subunit [Entamoeba marina]
MNNLNVLLTKYSPQTLDDFCHEQSSTELLKNIANSPNPPHLLVHGANGSGRYSRVMIILRYIYSDYSITTSRYTYTTEEGNELYLTSSEAHIEFNPTLYGVRDNKTLQWIIANTHTGPIKKTVIIHDAHNLSIDAQFSVRRAMETGSWRYIFITNNMSALMKPVRSRCLDIRIETPTPGELSYLLMNISQTENMSYPSETIDTIVNNCKLNIRTSLLELFVRHITHKDCFPEWKIRCREILNKIINDKSVTSIETIIRPALCEFIESGISPTSVMYEIYHLLLSSNLDGLYLIGIVEATTVFDSRVKKSNDKWVQVECYLTRLMTLFNA